MSDTPIGDAVAADLAFPPGDKPAPEFPNNVEDDSAADPGETYEPPADADPAPLLNDDADDPLDDLDDGVDDGDTDLNDDDDQVEEVTGNGE